MLNAESAMRRANEISKLSLGKSAPNPIVGAVIIGDDGQIISEGFHHSQGGGAHAEVVALSKAGQRANGATLFVTLEPCNHMGKTPPCTEAIVAAGIKKVVFAVSDPNPIAHGGAQALTDAGIIVEQGILKDEVAFTNRAWLKKIESSRPYITIKIAASLDGKVAALDGSSKWITSEISRSDVAILRSQCDAIVTGTGTVLADDPSLTVRNVERENFDFKPVRVILGNREIPQGSKVLDKSAETIQIKGNDLGELLELAKVRGWNQILIEAGPTLTSAFLRAGLFDEVFIYQAPTLLGSGLDFASQLEIKTLNQRLDLELLSADLLGDKEMNLRLHLLAVSK
jgi:diaminohydroxyphosphoribosylaminopyrimidine deaminase/5-amino-6-(5-phosphoribosylamino)uracil reductase